jgi:3-phenylpropionate/trans-cinnamate dioxygenase ferredoxin subunit
LCGKPLQIHDNVPLTLFASGSLPFALCYPIMPATFSIKHSGGNEMADVSIRPKPNGPYLIEGAVDVYDTAGNKIPTEDRPRIALCRCGASSNKPFCDGTHSKIGFQAAETINPESAE